MFHEVTQTITENSTRCTALWRTLLLLIAAAGTCFGAYQLEPGTVGAQYRVSLSSGGTSTVGFQYVPIIAAFGYSPFPYQSCNILSGSIPPGMTFTVNMSGWCALRGTPTAAGNFSWTMQAADS